MPSMGHYRNHTRGLQRLIRVQQMGVAIAQNGGVMPFTLILFKTGEHYLTLNNINTTSGGVAFGCVKLRTYQSPFWFTASVVYEWCRRQDKHKLLSQLHNNCNTILQCYYFLNYATYLVVVHCKSSKFNFSRNNNKSKFKRNRHAAQLAEGAGLRLGMHCACASVKNIGTASMFGIGPTRAPSFYQRPPHASSCRHWPSKGPMNLDDWGTEYGYDP